MGRIKGFFCSFCLDGRVDSGSGDTAFDRTIDVSHLATPHVTSSPTVKVARSLTPQTSDGNVLSRNNVEVQQASNSHDYPVAPAQSHSCNYQQSQQGPDQQGNLTDELSSHVRPDSSHNREAGPSSQSSPPCSQPQHPNHAFASLLSERNEQDPVEPQQLRRPQSREHLPPQDVQSPPPPPLAVARNSLPSTSAGPTTKLSYDIISVREPLAKILAERQQLLQNQQQQRQILGDHEYIEVYGERGSSCFYEEIAGSVTSSATYDQIGANSNHNYQVLINAYAVANRQPVANHVNYESNHTAQNVTPSSNSNARPGTNDNENRENTYDVTSHPSDRLDGASCAAGFSGDAQERIAPPANVGLYVDAPSNPDSSENAHLTQSIPVYSVINKATRRTSSIMRVTYADARPPKPPPKNSFISHPHSSTSAMTADTNGTSQETNAQRAWNLSPQTPSTSSYLEEPRTANDKSEQAIFNHRNNRLPQPPPRPSKNSAFNHTADRPLPSPNGNLDKLNNNIYNQTLDQNLLNRDEDIESINNGYELLKTNLEDDQIDVGYEKIRESNRYSGGSISSQFYSRQLLDNGGYESVQPIYSSPSNCYEVLNPATASEIAAAAAAKLNILEKFLNKD